MMTEEGGDRSLYPENRKERGHLCTRGGCRSHRTGNGGRRARSASGNCPALTVLLYLAVVLDTGGLYARTTLLVLAATLVCLLVLLRSGHRWILPCRRTVLLTGVLLVSAVFAAWNGIDRGWSLFGLVRLLTILLLVFAMQQIPEINKNNFLALLPCLGAAFVVGGGLAAAASACGMVLPEQLSGGPAGWFSEWISETGRLAGPFAYPNTMALFLVICFVIRVRGAAASGGAVKKWVLPGILVLGILLTGCRSVLVIFCGYLMVLALIGIRKRAGRQPSGTARRAAGACGGIPKPCAALLSARHNAETDRERRRDSARKLGGIASVLTGCVLLLYGLSFVFPGIRRLLELSWNESTLQGRFLYWEDALQMLLKYPAGVGYMGYLYLQQSMQTGVYDVRFVHNELLQWMLDYGIAAGAAAVPSVIRIFRRRTVPGWKKELLALILLCSLFDFHLQFWALWIVVSAVIPVREEIRTEGKCAEGKLRRPAGAILALALICVIWMAVQSGIACIYEGKGDYAAAAHWNPYATDLLVRYMLDCDDLETADAVADRILEQNDMVYAAVKIKANTAAERGDAAGFIEWGGEVLRLRKYDLEEYEGYLLILYKLSCETEDPQEQLLCAEAMLEVPDILNSVKAETSVRAWLLDETPDLILPEEYLNLLEAVKALRQHS